MQEIRSSNPPVVARIWDSNKCRARHRHSLKLGSKLTYFNKHWFLMSIWWILMNHFFQTWNVCIECIEFNWLCKYMERVRSCQASVLVLNWEKFSFSLWPPWVSLTYLWVVEGCIKKSFRRRRTSKRQIKKYIRFFSFWLTP